MIISRKTNIFDTGCEVIVNPVNCFGVMGAGLAKQFAKKYPKLEKQYIKDCYNRLVKVGELKLYEIDGQKIINFPTKDFWTEKSKLEWIEKGLDFFVKHYKNWSIKSIAFPALGCGLGGLNFDKQVLPLMIEKLSGLDIDIVVCVK